MQTKDLILRFVALVYLIAFLNFFKQNAGLIGDTGILPARALLSGLSQAQLNSFRGKPMLLHFTSITGGDVESCLDLLSLLGAVIALAAFVSQSFCIMPTFSVLWVLHFSVVQLLQSFVNQADLLLLEAGFLCMILAPFTPGKRRSPVDSIGLVMVRYLLFRFMFASGAVKLASGCPLWWNLKALKAHFETLPLPTFVAWYSFHLPEAYLKFTTVFVYLSELFCPWLFFVPNRTVRKFAFYWQIFLQFHVILTGNFGYLNFLVSVLLFSLLDLDDFYSKKTRGRDQFGLIALGIVIAGIGYILHRLFGLSWVNGELQTVIKFSKQEFLEVLKLGVQLGPLIATVSVIGTFLKSIVAWWSQNSGLFVKLLTILKLLLHAIFAIALIALSTVPHNNILPSTNITATPIGATYAQFRPYRFVNEYGLHLRKMRPERFEIIFEHAKTADGPWREYPFLYKPHRTDIALPFPSLYFPRVDFKLYEAAGTSPDRVPWVSSLAFRLLQNQPEVLILLGVREPIRPHPVFVRASLYKFKYTSWTERDRIPYWTRIRVSDYLPPFALNDTVLQAQVQKLRIPLLGFKAPDESAVRAALRTIHAQLSTLEGGFFIFGVVASAFAIILTQKAL